MSSVYQAAMVSIQEEWEGAMLAMEQRHCQLRVEMDDWKEALDNEKQANDKLTQQLQAQSSELEHRSTLLAEKQHDITKSVPPTSRRSWPLVPQYRVLTLLRFVCWLGRAVLQPRGAAG